jgi:hypothetical protein
MNVVQSLAFGKMKVNINIETDEKEVQDSSCRGSWNVHQPNKSPKIVGYRKLIMTISAFS